MDGVVYSAQVTACNSGGVCAYNASSPILHDSSPPIDGYFAVESGSTAVLNRTVPGGMTWQNRPNGGVADINLSFLGFLDPHSDIAEYWVRVGSDFSGGELTPGGAVLLQPSLASAERGVYLARFRLVRPLSAGEEVVYISLWAVNGVGLSSHVVQASFSVSEDLDTDGNGTLILLRSTSCAVQSCEGHCTCAARGLLCDPAPPCMEEADPTFLPPDMQVSVFSISPQLVQGGIGGSDILFTAATDKLIGRWELPEPSSLIERVEWSVGVEGFPPGAGLMDTARQGVWRQPDGTRTAVFDVSPAYPLMEGGTYVFHVRAWYSNSSFAVFTSSPGLTVDSRGPQTLRGYRPRTTTTSSSGGGGGGESVAFISSDSAVNISWDGVFLDTLSGGYSSFQVAIGNAPGSGDVLPFSPTIAPGVSSLSLSNLSLFHGRHYFTTVRATSPLGITTDSISLPFVVDLTPPTGGAVFAGLRPSPLPALTGNSSAVPVRLSGFSDPTSHIRHYLAAVTQSVQPPVESAYENIGIGLQAVISGLNLLQGQTYYVHAVAANQAGLLSPPATSDGVVFDSSRPVGVTCAEYGANVLVNPSFEGNNLTPCSASLSSATAGWEEDTSITSVLYNSPLDGFITYDGCSSLELSGTITQSFNSTPGAQYTLSFAVARQHPAGKFPTVNGFRVSAPGVSVDVVVPVLLEQGASTVWETFQFSFAASESTSTLSLSSSIDSVIVDGFSVRECLNLTELIFPDVVAVQWPDAITIGRLQALSQPNTVITASWNIRDPESGIREYRWAIGTVPGGQQLQSYTSTTSASHGVSAPLALHDGDELFVSVLAVNRAGLERVVYSRGYPVELTRPVSAGGGVADGLGGEDVDFQSSRLVSADWTALIDSSVGVGRCRWAVGE